MSVYEEAHDGVVRVTLKNPPVNAIPIQDAWTLSDIFNDVARREAVHAVILRAEGRGFSAGMDMKEIERISGTQLLIESGAAFEACFRAMDRCPVPVIAGVSDFCMGVGIGLVSCSDLILATPGAKFGVPEGAWGIAYLARLVLPMKQRQMAITGEPVSAEELMSYGSVYKICDPSRLDRECEQLARQLEIQSEDAPRRAKEKLIEITRSERSNEFNSERDLTLYHQSGELRRIIT